MANTSRAQKCTPKLMSHLSCAAWLNGWQVALKAVAVAPVADRQIQATSNMAEMLVSHKHERTVVDPCMHTPELTESRDPTPCR